MLEKEGLTEENTETVITRSLMIKKSVVEEDERESGLRKILNFGHTLGHGVESAEKMGGLYYMLMQVIYEVNEHGNDAFSGFSLKHNKKGIFALWGKDKLEVIGNIYENPELLEVEQ